MFRTISAHRCSRSEIVRHTGFDKEREGAHDAIFHAGSQLYRPLTRSREVSSQRRHGVGRFDVGLLQRGAHRPFEGGSARRVDIEAPFAPNAVGEPQRHAQIINPLLFLNAPFVEGAFKLRIQARVAHAGAEEPPLTQLLAHRKAHRHGTLVAFRLIEILQVLREVDVVEQKTVQLRLFERVQQRTVGHEIVRKLLQRMDFASHPSIGVVSERKIVETNGRIRRIGAGSTAEIHRPRVRLARSEREIANGRGDRANLFPVEGVWRGETVAVARQGGKRRKG